MPHLIKQGDKNVNAVCHRQGENDCRRIGGNGSQKNSRPARKTHTGKNRKRHDQNGREGSPESSQAESHYDQDDAIHKRDEGFHIALSCFVKRVVHKYNACQIDVDMRIFFLELVLHRSGKCYHLRCFGDGFLRPVDGDVYAGDV